MEEMLVKEHTFFFLKLWKGGTHSGDLQYQTVAVFNNSALHFENHQRMCSNHKNVSNGLLHN